MGGGVRDFERYLACNRETRLNVSVMLLQKNVLLIEIILIVAVCTLNILDSSLDLTGVT